MWRSGSTLGKVLLVSRLFAKVVQGLGDDELSVNRSAWSAGAWQPYVKEKPAASFSKIQLIM